MNHPLKDERIKLLNDIKVIQGVKSDITKIMKGLKV